MALKEEFSVGQLNVRSIKAPVEGTAASVTQGTDRSTPVTSHGYAGTIVTNAASLATGAEATFTVTNNKVNTGSVVVLSIVTPSATGLSIAFVSKIQAGSFDITLSNLHGTTADTSATTLNYFVINGNP